MRRVLFIAFAPLVLFSCSDDKAPTEPGEFSGDYQVESIEGQPLPFIDMLAPFTGDTLFILSGDMSVFSRGRLRIVYHRQWRPRNKPPESPTTDTLVREYRVEGDFVYVDHPTGGLQGPYTDTVEVYDNALTLRQLVNRYNLGHFWRDVYFVRK
jgi:hypothetical protein